MCVVSFEKLQGFIFFLLNFKLNGQFTQPKQQKTPKLMQKDSPNHLTLLPGPTFMSWLLCYKDSVCSSLSCQSSSLSVLWRHRNRWWWSCATYTVCTCKFLNRDKSAEMGVHVNCDCLMELHKNFSQVFAETLLWLSVWEFRKILGHLWKPTITRSSVQDKIMSWS